MKFLDYIFPNKNKLAELSAINEQLKTALETSNKRAFAMAQHSNILNDWVNLARSVNYDIRQGASLMRKRARDLAKNNSYARKFIHSFANNIVGADGFTLRNKAGEYIKDKNNKYKFQLDVMANRMINDVWWEWMKKKNCTITENMSFRELSILIAKNVAIDGEVFIIHLSGKKYGIYGYQLQLIEPEYCDEQFNEILPNGNMVVMGVEVDENRKTVAYWFTKYKNNNELYGGANIAVSNDRVRIPAENVTHLFIREFAYQYRGYTLLAPVSIKLKMLDGWDEAAVVNARTAACKTGILQPKDNQENSFTNYETNADGNVVQSIEPNEIFMVPEGYSWLSHSPEYPHSQHKPFNETILRGIASGLNVSYHTLASDYSSVNYTSSRTALLDERDAYKNLQSWFIEHFLEEVFSRLLKMAILSGQLNLPIEKYDKFNQPYFVGRRWQWVDPENEVNANMKAIKSYQTTYEQIWAEKGYDLDEALDIIAQNKELFIEKLNINPYEELKPPSAPTKEPVNVGDNNNGNGKFYYEFMKG